MDFTPVLAQWRVHHALAAQLLNDSRVVLCLGNHGLLLALGSGSPEGMRVVGAATGADEGLRLVDQWKPELLVTSDRLEQGCGSALVVAVKRRHPAVQTLLLVGQGVRRARLRAAIAAGCEAVVAEARLTQGAVIDAIRAIRSGGSYLDRRVLAAVTAPTGLSQEQPLSRRECDVLGLAMQGESNEQIARHLFVSAQTVKTHMSNVLRKLGARDRTHAVVLALHRGLMDFAPVEGCLG